MSIERLLFTAALLFGAELRADYLYTFQYTANAATSIQSFHFALAPVPSLITAPPDSTPAFNAFMVTDGLVDTTFATSLAGFNSSPQNAGCFGFATGGGILTLNGCSWNIDAAEEGALTVRFAGALPSTIGVFTPTSFSGMADLQRFTPRTGSLTLTIEPVPEPATVALFLTCAGLVALQVRLRR